LGDIALLGSTGEIESSGDRQKITNLVHFHRAAFPTTCSAPPLTADFDLRF
jgi:hypothetical protein